MNIKTVTLYTCDHCKKEYKRLAYAKRHEEYCWKNSENNYRESCHECKFLKRIESEETYRPRAAWYGSQPKKYHFECIKDTDNAVKVHTRRAGSFFRINIKGSVRMPKDCDYKRTAEIPIPSVVCSGGIMEAVSNTNIRSFSIASSGSTARISSTPNISSGPFSDWFE